MNEEQVQRNILTSELEQLVAEAHTKLKAKGVDWTEKLNELILGVRRSGEQPWNYVGLLAEIGYIYALTQFADAESEHHE